MLHPFQMNVLCTMDYLSYKEASEYTGKSISTIKNLRRKAISEGITTYEGKEIFKEIPSHTSSNKVLILKDYLKGLINPLLHPSSNPFNQGVNQGVNEGGNPTPLEDYRKQIEFLQNQLTESTKANSELRQLLAAEKMEKKILLQEKEDLLLKQESKSDKNSLELMKEEFEKKFKEHPLKPSVSSVGKKESYEEEYIKKETPKRKEILNNLKNGKSTKSEQFLSFLKDHPMH